MGFLDWYGENRDAFWDAITALVEIPNCLVLQNWEHFAKICPKDMHILREIMADYHQQVPGKEIWFDF